MTTTDWNHPESTAAAAIGAAQKALDALGRLPATVRRDHRILIDRVRSHLDRGTVFGRDVLLDLETLVQALRPIFEAEQFECMTDLGDGDYVPWRHISDDGRSVQAALTPLWETLHHASRTRDVIRAQRAVRHLEDAAR